MPVITEFGAGTAPLRFRGTASRVALRGLARHACSRLPLAWAFALLSLAPWSRADRWGRAAELGGAAAPLYTILLHEGLPLEPARHGIWTFDRGTRQFTRLRPFYYNVGQYEHGSASYLSATADRLLFEGWPGYLEIDVATMRDLRRYSPVLGRDSLGWTFWGAAVSAAAGAAAGLPAGVYGRAECGLLLLFNLDYCGLYPETLGQGAAARAPGLFLLPDIHDSPAVELVDDLDQLGVGATYLGKPFIFDHQARGFWKVEVRKVIFLPAVDGRIAVESRVETELVPPLVDPESWFLSDLELDPEGSGFYGIRTWIGRSNVKEFVAVDNEFTLVDVFTHTENSGLDSPMPTTFTSFPEVLPAEYEQAIPVIARTAGLNGTFWSVRAVAL